jgi:eukaryotic-like serine/threonine-protein kinase
MTEEASSAPHAPRLTIGRYALYGPIGAGGMATVHFGRLCGIVGFARTVAIKRMHPELARDPEFVAMLIDEARLAARIRHANVVEIIDVVAMDQELLLVMDYVPGEALSRLIDASARAGRPIPERTALAIVCDLLHGLQAAHEARDERGQPLCLVHRDVSPHNVLVGVDGVARVHDFGTAKAKGRVQNTREGQIKGRLAYMAPEQVRADVLEARCDVYAAGVVLWELLTLRRLIPSGPEEEMLENILRRPLPDLREFAPSASAGLEAIVSRALSRDLKVRFPTARDFAIALEMAAPSARPREVGDWVQDLARDSLLERARILSRIESTPVELAESAALGPERDGDDHPTRVRDQPRARGKA